MKNLHRVGSSNQPKVDFLAEDATLSISGSSVMETPKAYYLELINWVKDFTKVIKKETSVELAFSELNQKSLKMLLFLCQELKALEIAGQKVTVYWSFPKENAKLKEAGQDLSYLSDLEFQFISINTLEPTLV